VAKAIVKSTANSSISTQLFTAIPTERDLKLSTPEMRTALCLLLGIPLRMKAAKCGCDEHKELTMYHALSCKSHGNLINRHDQVKNVLAQMCRAAGLDYDVEPRQALSGNKLRPDILVRCGKDNGLDIAFDLTIVNPVRDDRAITTSAQDEQKFLKQSAVTKDHKYAEQCEKNYASFTPVVLSAFGGVLDESYNDAIKYLLDRIPNKEFESPNWAAPDKTSYWHQRIVVALWKGNFRQMGSFVEKRPILKY